jgi:hypothetical protein
VAPFSSAAHGLFNAYCLERGHRGAAPTMVVVVKMNTAPSMQSKQASSSSRGISSCGNLQLPLNILLAVRSWYMHASTGMITKTCCNRSISGQRCATRQGAAASQN